VKESRVGIGTIPSAANLAALAHVRTVAESTRRRDAARIRRVLRAASISADVDDLCTDLRRISTITINFHPDRLGVDGRSVAEALATDGIYRSQFETRISNGGLTAYPGGDRDRWEEALFSGAYQTFGIDAGERPRYGGLELFGFANGACPRFGSCHLRLRAAALDRSTFFVGDSVLEPQDGGVIDRLEPVLAGLLERAARGDGFGRTTTIGSLVDHLMAADAGAPGAAGMNHALDGYVEAQVHGPITLATDVEAVAIDPSFRGTPDGQKLLDAARHHRLDVDWHNGLQLDIDEIPIDVPADAEEFRWGQFCGDGLAANLARRLVSDHATDGRHLDAATLGRAAVSVVRQPNEWQPWPDAEDPLTRIKDLWHILVVYGRPAERDS
jgi:hypothetical protein